MPESIWMLLGRVASGDVAALFEIYDRHDELEDPRHLVDAIARGDTASHARWEMAAQANLQRLEQVNAVRALSGAMR